MKYIHSVFAPISVEHGHLQAMETGLVEPLLTPVTLQHLQVPTRERQRELSYTTISDIIIIKNKQTKKETHKLEGNSLARF